MSQGSLKKLWRKPNQTNFQNTIEIIRTRFSVHSLNIYVDNVVRYLKMETVYLNVNIFIIDIGVKIPNDFTAVSVFELKVINCEIVSKRVETSLSLLNSFAKFSFQNTVFGQIEVKPDQHEGLVSFVFDNCTFLAAFSFNIVQVVDFKILQSSIKVPYHCGILDCAVHLTGVTSDEKLSAFFID